eukprot:3568601-Pleurochrysis_carterae.AAC.1
MNVLFCRQAHDSWKAGWLETDPGARWRDNEPDAAARTPSTILCLYSSQNSHNKIAFAEPTHLARTCQHPVLTRTQHSRRHANMQPVVIA